MENLVVENMKIIRKDTGLKQFDFANMLDIKPTIIENIESGRRKVDVEVVERIANKLGISPNWLILGIGPKEFGDKELEKTDDDIYSMTKRSLKFRVLEFRNKIGFFADANVRYLREYWKNAIVILENDVYVGSNSQKIQNSIKNANPKFSYFGNDGLAKFAPGKDPFFGS